MAKAVFITKQGNATSVQIQDGGVTAFSYLFNEPQDLIAKGDGEHIVITEAVNHNSPSITFKFSDIDDKLSATTSHEYLEAAATAGLFFSGVSAGGGGTGGTSYTFENGLTETDGTVTWYDEVVPGIAYNVSVPEGSALTIGDLTVPYGLSIGKDGASTPIGIQASAVNINGSTTVEVISGTQIDIDVPAGTLNLNADIFNGQITGAGVLDVVTSGGGSFEIFDVGSENNKILLNANQIRIAHYDSIVLDVSAQTGVGVIDLGGDVINHTFNTLNLIGDSVGDNISIQCEQTTSTGNITAAEFSVSALNTAPATAASTGTTGEIRITATHIYVCTATDTWVRADLATW